MSQHCQNISISCLVHENFHNCLHISGASNRISEACKTYNKLTNSLVSRQICDINKLHCSWRKTIGLHTILEYLATSGAKSDIIFLLGDPDFLWRQWNFSPISLSFRDLTRVRQTDDRHGDRNRRLSHLSPVHYTLPIYMGRKYGPYIRVSKMTPVYTAHIYRCKKCKKVRPYIRTIYRARMYGPYVWVVCTRLYSVRD